MEFEDASSFFDETPVYDAYSGVFLFLCHTTSHNDQTSSGATARRRTMTTVVDTSRPARGAVTVHSDDWLVSDSNPDGYRGSDVRRSYSLKKSTGLMALLTPAEAAASAPGLSLHAQKEYFRDTQDARSSSEWDVMWNIFTAQSEALAKGSFLRQGSTLFRVRNTYPSVDGYRISETDEFDSDALQSATFTTSEVLDLVHDTLAATSVTVNVVQTDSMKFYRYRVETEAEYKPGDRIVFVAKADLTPAVAMEFTMLGATWRVLSLVSEDDTWALRARLA